MRLRFLVSLGLINLLIKFDTKFIFTLEVDMNRLFETNIQAANITAPYCTKSLCYPATNSLCNP